MVFLHTKTARFKSPGHKNELCFFRDTLLGPIQSWASNQSHVSSNQDSKFRQAFASMVLAPFSSRPQPLISSRQQSYYNRENLETPLFLVLDAIQITVSPKTMTKVMYIMALSRSEVTLKTVMATPILNRSRETKIGWENEFWLIVFQTLSSFSSVQFQ